MGLAALFGILVLFSSSFVTGQRTATQVARGLCLKDKIANTLKLDFRLDTQNDPTGALWAMTPNSVRDTNCNIQLMTTGTTGIYHVVSSVNLNTNLAISNGCSYTSQAVTNGVAFTWLFLYHERADRPDIDAGLNRLYTVTCNPDNMQENEAQAVVIPSTPQQSESIEPYVPQVTLSLLRQTASGIYVPVSPSDQILVGTPVKLRLSLHYGTFDPNKYYGVAGLRTLFSGTSSFVNPLLFFNDNGCTASNLAPALAFEKVSNGANSPAGSRVFVQETGSFPVWLIGNTGNVYIKVYYQYCHGSNGFDTVPLCNNPCAALSGRKRRQSESLEDSQSAFISVKVVTEEEEMSETQAPSSEEQNTDIMYALIGACVGVCVILLVLVIVVFCVVRRTKRTGGKREKSAQRGFENGPY